MPPIDHCAFCEIARGDSPAEIVFADRGMMAFLDHRPLFPGHTLLIPMEHHATLSDLPHPLIEPLFAVAQQLSVAIESGTGAEGTFVAMNNKVSQSVPHLHIHIVPRKRKDGLRGFFWPRHRYGGPEEMSQAAALIRAALQEGAR